jgi:RNA polymerase sigma-70 factor (ECF subfamily)
MSEQHLENSVEALKSGDRAAFARLVYETSGYIYRAALQITGSAQDAEDALQETYLKAMRALPGFEGRSSLKTWLYRIAVNEALMLVRKHRRPVVSMDAESEGEEGDVEGMEIVDWCCQPEAELLSGEARRMMEDAVRSLPETLRTVFILRDLEGLSIQETAEVLNLGESAVKVRLLRARLKLRQELSVYYGSRLQKEGNP